jgi:hypothetical protein
MSLTERYYASTMPAPDADRDPNHLPLDSAYYTFRDEHTDTVKR